jgi:hypothetical protein
MAPQPTQSPQNTYSSALHDKGLAGLEEIRRARRYGTDLIYNNPVTDMTRSPANPTGNPSYKSYGTQTSPSNLFDQWLTQVTPQQYQPSFTGRTPNGKYGGYSTLGLLKDSLQGQANMLRSQERSKFEALQQLANQNLDKVTQDYATAAGKDLNLVHDSAGTSNLTNASVAQMADAYARRNAALPGVDKQQAKTVTDSANHAMWTHNGQLADWTANEYGKQQGLYDLGSQGMNAPESLYAQRVGANMGISPDLLAGWYTPATDMRDRALQKSLAFIQRTGMTPEENIAALSEMLSTGKSQAAAADQNTLDAISQTTGFNGQQLSTATRLEPNLLLDVVTSEPYAAVTSEVNAAFQAGDTVKAAETIGKINPTDPLFEVLVAQYKRLFPATYDLTDPNTWA